MKFRNLFIYGLLIVLCSSFSGVTFAQDKKDEDYKKKIEDSTLNPDGTYKSKTLDESRRPEDSYLAKFHAMDVIQVLMRDNLEQIYLLKVIVSNYKEKGWENDYKKAYEGYKLAMESFYQRNVIYSRLYFEENKKFISDLLKKISEDYKKQTNDMLHECASKLMELHLDERTRSDPSKTEELFKNQMRLRISYGQFDDGQQSYIGTNYVSSILHYRVARTYAIKILEDLSKPDESEKEREKYKIHKADNLNRIFETGSKESGTTTKTEPKTGPK